MQAEVLNDFQFTVHRAHTYIFEHAQAAVEVPTAAAEMTAETTTRALAVTLAMLDSRIAYRCREWNHCHR